MTDRIDPGGGGMTGATGDLTPDEVDEAFVPGELREVAGERDRARVTHEQGLTAPAQQGDVGDPTGEDAGGTTNMAERESGYGSEHGLAPDDPAYRMEEPHPPAPAAPETQRGGETRIGGDEAAEEEDRF